ncbi:hypothetical protein [Tautonia rosea]|uniref:hypothetical protein n=1 Tax=Tautonia rosea TaxID=2728037 RepID=UPI001473ED1A|nr:hypothetical protein [Tautonia rosea]
MIGPFGSRNPYESPSPRQELTLDLGTSVGSERGIFSVTFQVTHDVMKRAGKGGLSPLMMTGFVLMLALIGMGLAVVPFLREHGVTRDSLRVLLVSALPMLALVGAIVWISVRKRGRGSQETPFETTVVLTPSELVIRDEGLAELRRSWSSIPNVSHNRYRIRFDFLMFDPTTGRFTSQVRSCRSGPSNRMRTRPGFCRTRGRSSRLAIPLRVPD